MSSFLLSKLSAETLKSWGLKSIIFGLVAEAVVIVFVPSGSLEKALSVVCTLVIASGVWIEEIGDRAIATQSRKTRREILAGKTTAITERLQPFAGTQFDCGLNMNSGEQADFWWDLQPAITAAGWAHLPWDFPPMVGGLLVTQGPDRPASGSVAAANVEIHLHPEHRERLLPAATALISALNEIGIAARDAGYNTHSANNAAIHILIGDKG